MSRGDCGTIDPIMCSQTWIRNQKHRLLWPVDMQTAASPVVRSKDTNDAWQQAAALLNQARAAMDVGKLSEAQQLADKAAEFDVAYTMFEDSPRIVSRDIKRLAASGSAAFKAFASTSNDAHPTRIRLDSCCVKLVRP